MSKLRFTLAAVLVVIAGLASAQVTIHPSTPRAQETVRVQVAEGVIEPFTSDSFDSRARVSMSGNRITVVVINRGRQPTLPEPSPPIDQPLGAFPAGEFQVEVRVEDPQGAVLKTVGTASFFVWADNSGGPPFNMTDLWWVPSESGWGLNIVQHPSGVVFATWLVYDADGEAAWYFMPDARWSGVFRGPLYRSRGPAFCFDGEPCPRPPFDPGAVTITLVGEMAISPFDYDRAGLTVRMDGKTLTRFIRRQSF